MVGEWLEKSNDFFRRVGAKYIEKRIDDDKFWSEVLRMVLNPKIGKMYSQELVYAFEKNMDLSDLYRQDHTEAMKNLAKGNEDVLVKIKHKLAFSLPMFTWEWIEDWWKKDQPKLLAIINNHPKSPEFKRWMVEGIRKLCLKISETL